MLDYIYGCHVIVLYYICDFDLTGLRNKYAIHTAELINNNCYILTFLQDK